MVLNKTCSILNKSEIKKELKNRHIIVEPIDYDTQINSVSIDLRLDCYFGEFIITEEPFIDVAKVSNEFEIKEIEFFHETYTLHPGKFVLGQTLEYIVLPNYIVATLDGRSSLGRRGITVHATAGYVDPGWRGHLVFELANLGEMPVRLYPGMRIARLTFFRLPGKEDYDYTGQFRWQLKITKPKVDDDVKRLHIFMEEAKSESL